MEAYYTPQKHQYHLIKIPQLQNKLKVLMKNIVLYGSFFVCANYLCIIPCNNSKM
jgi:hypothetical protein